MHIASGFDGYLLTWILSPHSFIWNSSFPGTRSVGAISRLLCYSVLKFRWKGHCCLNMGITPWYLTGWSGTCLIHHKPNMIIFIIFSDKILEWHKILCLTHFAHSHSLRQFYRVYNAVLTWMFMGVIKWNLNVYWGTGSSSEFHFCQNISTSERVVSLFYCWERL